MGRPSSFSQDKADAICALIASGRSLRSICEQDDQPDQTTVYRWLRTEEAFRLQYARAREDQAETIFDEMLQIADDGSNDTWMNEDGLDILNTDHIQRSKLRIDARKWVLGKMAPKKYGDRLQLANDPDDPMPGLTDAQIEARVAELMAKSNG